MISKLFLSFKLFGRPAFCYITCVTNREEDDKRRRRALKPVEDEGLHDEEDVSVVMAVTSNM